MAHDPHHEHLVKEIEELFEPILSMSPQAIYIYLDDEHKICNQKFADLLDYESVQKWVENKFPVSDVDEKDQQKVIKSYMEASKELKASSLNVAFTTKKGEKIKTEIIMAPFTYKDEVFVIHFINKS